MPPFSARTSMPSCGDLLLQTGGHERRLGDQQRHRLPLHVRAHQRAVGVVVLEERDQPAETPTICFGETSMYSTLSAATV